MKLELHRTRTLIVPEDDKDEVYLEAVLGLQLPGDTAIACRVAPVDLPQVWAYVEVRKGHTI